MDSQGKLGWEYTISHIREGKVIHTQTAHNLIPTAGLNHIIDAVVNGGSAYATWYIALYEGNYTPVAGVTAATIVADSTETTAYAETVRQTYVGAAASGGATSNIASKAEFTFNATKTIYGGFMSSNSAKSSTTGMILSAVRFTSPRSVVSGDILQVTAGLTLTSA